MRTRISSTPARKRNLLRSRCGAWRKAVLQRSSRAKSQADGLMKSIKDSMKVGKFKSFQNNDSSDCLPHSLVIGSINNHSLVSGCFCLLDLFLFKCRFKFFCSKDLRADLLLQFCSDQKRFFLIRPSSNYVFIWANGNIDGAYLTYFLFHSNSTIR